MLELGRFINVPRTSFPRSSNGFIFEVDADPFSFFADGASADSLADCRRVFIPGADEVNNSSDIHSIDMLLPKAMYIDGGADDDDSLEELR